MSLASSLSGDLPKYLAGLLGLFALIAFVLRPALKVFTLTTPEQPNVPEPTVRLVADDELSRSGYRSSTRRGPR